MRLSRRIKNTLHPEGYHGRNAGSPYFEGWYFKLVDAGGEHRYAVIPGISLGEAGRGPHSFVQVFNGATGETSYVTYPVADFHAADDRLDITIGPNHFTSHDLSLDLEHRDHRLSGHVTFTNPAPKPWPVTPTAPGMMGWYAWVPRMECFHGVPSLDHGLQGSLSYGAQTLDFTDGHGYIEKDWGRAFPSSWVWMQSNHFGTPGICLTASIATIPWIGYTFPGFIVGLLLGNTLLRFTTYTGAVTRHLDVTAQHVSWVLEDIVYRLALTAHRGTVGMLRGPTLRDMTRPVPETLSATIEVELTARQSGQILFQDTGRYAGLEISGPTEELARKTTER